MIRGRAGALVAVGVMAVVTHMSGAHAALPTSPCGYECLWPIGSYEVPSSMRVGDVTAVKYTYSWEEAPGNGAIGTLAQRDLPPGRHAWPEEWGEPARPRGYAGSAVTLVLPEGVSVDGWERLGLERSEAWTDHYGRTTYMYAGLNAYTKGVSVASIELSVEPDAVIYPDDEVWIDLGVRGTEWRDPAAWLNRAGDTVSVSAEPAGASGSGGDPFPHRDMHVLPESAFAPLDEEELGGDARGKIVEFLLDQADSGVPLGESDVPGFARAQVMGRVGGEASGEIGEGSFVYAYGKLLMAKRSLGYGGQEIFASPAEGVKACAHKSTNGGRTLTLLTHDGVPACAMVDAGGFYGFVVPRDGPGGGAGVDILPVFSLESEQAKALTSRNAVFSFSGRAAEDVSGATVSLGEHRVEPKLGLLNTHYVAYSDVLGAHEYFKDAVGYDAPLVNIRYDRGGTGAYYSTSSNTITLTVSVNGLSYSPRSAVLHEYGHHIMNSVYDRGVPYARNCNPHDLVSASSPACAWTEGWAHFAQALVEGVPVLAGDNRGDLGTHDNWETHKSHVVFGFSDRDPRTGSSIVRDYYLGEDGEGSVAAILWDMHDGFEEPGDDVRVSVQDMWAAFADPREENEEHTAVTVHDFYSDWIDRGGQNLDSVFAINGVDIAPRFTPPSLALSVERGGVARLGDYAAYAKEADAVVARLDLGRAAEAGTTPTASLFGGAMSVMSPAGDGRRVWTSSAAVPGGAPDGAASVTIRAVGPGLEAAGSQAVDHDDGSDTVKLRLASVPLDGKYDVTARASVADSGGATLGSDQSRVVEWNAARPAVDTATISPDGREMTLVLSEGVNSYRPRCVDVFGSRDDIRVVDQLHVPGSSVVKLHMANAPEVDAYLWQCPSAAVDTQGHVVILRSEPVPWNPEAPAFEHVTVDPDGRTLTLTFSEKVRVWVGPVIRPGQILPVTDGQTLSTTHTVRLAQALTPGPYELSSPHIYTDGSQVGGRHPAFSERRAFTYNPSGPTFDHAKLSPDGGTLTLTFSEGLDGDSVTQDRFALGGGLALAEESPILHEDESRTVYLRLASAPASDGAYSVTAKGALRSPAGAGLGTDQTRVFTWNPEAPTLEHVGVSADGRTLTLAFSEALHGDTLSVDTIQVSSGLAWLEWKYTPGSDKVLLELARAPPPGTHHVYVERDVADAAGRQMAVRQERAFTWDAAPPSFESVEASADGRTLTLAFSEGLDARTVTTCGVPRIGTSCPLAARATTTGNFKLPEGLEFITGDAARPILHTDGGSQVIIRLASPPPQAGTYTVTAKAAIRDTTNVAMVSDQSRSFSWTPGVPKLESAAFTRDGRTVTLKFSEGLNTDTVTADSVSIDGGSAALLVTQRAAGTGGVTVDTEAPRLLDALFTSTGEVRLEFSEPLDDTTVTEAAFAVSPIGGAPLVATPSYTKGDRAVAVAVAPAAAAGIAHDVSVRAGLTDRAGNPVPATTLQRTPPGATSAAPTFTAKTATLGTGGVTVVTFSQDVRLIAGQELDPRDWIADGVRRSTHYVDLESRKVWLRTAQQQPKTLVFSPEGGSPKIESLAGHDLPVGASAAVPIGLFPSFFADTVSKGRIEVSFNLSLVPQSSFVTGTETISGTTAASEWRVNGEEVTGLSTSATGAPVSSIDVSSALSFYLHHGVTGGGEALQVEYVGAPEGSPNSLVNSGMKTLGPTSVTVVDQTRNAITRAEFLDSRTVKATATKALDARWADRLYVNSVHVSESSPDMSDPRSAVVRLNFDARDGCLFIVGINSPGRLSDIVLGDTRGNGIRFVDSYAPVIRSATTSGTSTDVAFNEPVSFGDSPTLEQHKGHWSVEADGVAMEITSVDVSDDDASVVTIEHAALPRPDASPTVTYDGTADDDARVRDTRASSCTDADATPKNVQGSTLSVVAADGAAPGAASVSAAVSRGGGAPKAGPNALWAGIGDTVTVSLAMDEDGREASPPRLIAAGSRVEMARGETARLWSGGVGIGAGAAQGALGYTITAPDAAGNLGVFVDDGRPAAIAWVDTMPPEIDSAETVSAGRVRVTLTEGAWGAASASDWTVGGARATGISAGGAAFAPTVALSGDTSIVLEHPAAGTGGAPVVEYGAAGAPGAAPDPAPAPGPVPPPSGIALDVGALDGAEIRLGESRPFGVSVTVADGGAAVVRLSGQPGFVSVENTDINRALVTVDAGHASATAGEHTFDVIAATGSDPETRRVTITVL